MRRVEKGLVENGIDRKARGHRRGRAELAADAAWVCQGVKKGDDVTHFGFTERRDVERDRGFDALKLFGRGHLRRYRAIACKRGQGDCTWIKCHEAFARRKVMAHHGLKACVGARVTIGGRQRDIAQARGAKAVLIFFIASDGAAAMVGQCFMVLSGADLGNADGVKAVVGLKAPA